MSTLGKYLYTGAAVTLAAGDAVAFSGGQSTCGMSDDGSTVTISKPGNYLVTASAVMQATAAGAVGFALYRNGTQVAAAASTQTAAAAGDAASGSVATLVTCPRCGQVALSLRATAAEQITSASLIVERV